LPPQTTHWQDGGILSLVDIFISSSSPMTKKYSSLCIVSKVCGGFKDQNISITLKMAALALNYPSQGFSFDRLDRGSGTMFIF
jgi:hypothetical protein